MLQTPNSVPCQAAEHLAESSEIPTTATTDDGAEKGGFAAQIDAQGQWQTGNRVFVRGGVSVPMFNYGLLPITIADYTPQEGRTPAGAAMLGATLGAMSMYRLHPQVAVIGSVDVNYNPYNTDEAGKQLRTSIGAINLLGLNINLLSSALASILQTSSAFSAQPHWNGSVTAGLRYDFQIVPAIFSAYLSGELGAFVGAYPKIESRLNLTFPLFNINAEVLNTIQSATGAAFVWAVGGGLLVSERVNIGVRFFAANPTYTSNISTTVNSSGGATGTLVIPGIGRISSQDIVASVLGAFPERSAPFAFPTSAIQCTIGYAF